MQIRQLVRTDIPKILELEKHSGPDKPLYSRYDEKALNFIFDNPQNCGALGLFKNDKLIGWCAFRTNWKKHGKEKNICEISSVVIDRNYRRQGFGKKLLNEIINILEKKENVNRIFLTVSPLNTAALLLYVKRGFLVYDFRKDVYWSWG